MRHGILRRLAAVCGDTTGAASAEYVLLGSLVAAVIAGAVRSLGLSLNTPLVTLVAAFSNF